MNNNQIKNDKYNVIVYVIKLLKLNYPYFYKEADDEEMESLINLWYTKLKNVDESQLITAIDKIISTSKFPPTLADVLGEIAQLNLPIIPKFEYYWDNILKASRNSLYNAEIEHKKLPKEIQDFIPIFELKEIAMSDDTMLHFIKKELSDKFNYHLSKIIEDTTIQISSNSNLSLLDYKSDEKEDNFNEK